MTDEKYLFVSDSIEKKKTGNSARNRRTHNGKGGNAKLPCDYMTKKDLEAMNGDCVSYRLNEPMTWAGFKSMPDDIQRDYIRLLRQKYGVSNTDLADMFGAQRPTVSAHLSKLGLEHSKKWAHVADAEGWNRFLGRQPNKTEEEQIPVQPLENHNIDSETPENNDFGERKTVVPITGMLPMHGTVGSRTEMKLEKENVRIILGKFLDGIKMFDANCMEAEKNLAYIAGLRDMANAVIEAIRELEG